MYVRDLRQLQAEKKEIISSESISERLGISPVQFRKDLSYFGEFGRRGIGYKVSDLVASLEEVLGLNVQWKLALVGVGSLGRALLKYPGFEKLNMKITRAFDCDKRKIGRVIAGVKVEDIKNLCEVVKAEKIKIGVLCVGANNAEQVAHKMVDCGIKAIFNFAPVEININNHKVYISNIDMAVEISTLVYYVAKNN